ncbi:unnamed protein product [Pylaiella littoralis]
MVPGAGVRNGKRKAEHQRHDSASKKAMEGYFRQAYATMNGQDASHGFSSTRADINSGEEATDDESEFSSLDGRISPSRPVAWGAPAAAAGVARGGGTASSNAASHFHALGQHGYAMAPPGGLNFPAGMVHHQQVGTASQNAASWSATSGNPNAGYQQHQQQQLQQQQQEQLLYQQQHQHQLQQQQVSGRRMMQGGGTRAEGDEWGWFVDAGEQEQQPHPGPAGVRRSSRG